MTGETSSLHHLLIALPWVIFLPDINSATAAWQSFGVWSETHAASFD